MKLSLLLDMISRTPSVVRLFPLTVLLIAVLGCVPGAQQGGLDELPTPPAREVDGAEAYDEPAAAADFYQRQRQAYDGRKLSLDERYGEALAQQQKMERYASAVDKRMPPSAASSSSSGAKAALLDGWQSLGPGNIGGRTRALLVDPVQPQVMYAAGVSGGVWKSTNAGGRWRALDDRMANLAVSTLAMNPRNRQVIYAGTGEGVFSSALTTIHSTGLSFRGGGIFESRDGGARWRRLPGTGIAEFAFVNDLLVSAADPRRIYAATQSGVWRSLNGGGTWRKVLDPQVFGGCLDLEFVGNGAVDSVLASCGTFVRSALYRAADASTNAAWPRVLSEAGMGRTSLAVSPSNPQVVYALASSFVEGPDGNQEGALHAVFRSNQAGRAGTWQPRIRWEDGDEISRLLLSGPLFARFSECGFGDNSFRGQGWYDNVIAVDPTDPDVVWAGGIDLFRSEDGGRSWGLASYWWANPSSPSYVHADQHAIVFHPRYNGTTNRILYIGNDGGIFRTDNASRGTARGPQATCSPTNSRMRFQSLNRDYGVTQFYHGAAYPSGNRYLAGAQDNGTLTGTDGAGPNGWREVFGGDGAYVAVDPQQPNRIWISTQFMGLQRSTDGGQNFGEAVTGLPESRRDSFLFITPYMLDPSDSSRLWTGGEQAYRSTNGAASWQAASATFRNGEKVSAVAVAATDPNRVMMGLTDGRVFTTSTALTDTGASRWTTSRPRAGYVSWLAIDPANAEVAYATYAGFGGRHVFRTRNGGASWTPIDGNGGGRLPNIPVLSLAIDPSNRQRLFVGTDLGVFVTLNGGASWQVENTGFANVVTETLQIIRQNDGRTALFAFTHGRGAWRVILPGGGGGGDGGGGDGGGGDDGGGDGGSSCPWPPGHGHFCRDCGPCANAQGDCDRDSDCGAGLECVNDIGAQFGFGAGVDVCRPAAGGACPWPLGHGHYCRDCGPCAAGQGDCDGDSQCQAGLVCANDVGAEFGFSAATDVCR